MQTFLPFENFQDTAMVLDYRRLGKQRVETMQILSILNNETNSWKNHPIVSMWRNHELMLIEYGLVICEEWVGRGYKDNVCRDKILSYKDVFSGNDSKPVWLGDEELHLSHRSQLMYKKPDFYNRYNWNIGNSVIPYKWYDPNSNKYFIIKKDKSRLYLI